MRRRNSQKNESFRLSASSNKWLCKFAVNAGWIVSIRCHPVTLVILTVSLFGVFDFLKKVIEKPRSRAKQNHNSNAPNLWRNAMKEKSKEIIASVINGVAESVMHGGMGIALASL
jgi:hypothetical protein